MMDLDTMNARELREYARNHGMSSITRLHRATQLRAAIRAYVSNDGSAVQAEPEITNLWAEVKPGSVMLLGGKRFRLAVVDPTTTDSPYAWLTGLYVTANGKPARGSVEHLHVGNGEREEFVHIDQVRVFI